MAHPCPRLLGGRECQAPPAQASRRTSHIGHICMRPAAWPRSRLKHACDPARRPWAMTAAARSSDGLRPTGVLLGDKRVGTSVARGFTGCAHLLAGCEAQRCASPLLQRGSCTGLQPLLGPVWSCTRCQDRRTPPAGAHAHTAAQGVSSRQEPAVGPCALPASFQKELLQFGAIQHHPCGHMRRRIHREETVIAHVP